MYSATISRQQASGWNRRRTISILGGQRPWRGKAGQTSSGSLPTERRPNRHLRLRNYVKQSAFHVLSSGDDATPKRCSLNLNQNPLARSLDETTEPKKSNHEFSYFPNVLIFPKRLRGGGSKFNIQCPDKNDNRNNSKCGTCTNCSQTNERHHNEKNNTQCIDEASQYHQQHFSTCKRSDENDLKNHSTVRRSTTHSSCNQRQYHPTECPPNYESRPCERESDEDDDGDDDDECENDKAGCCPCYGCGGAGCQEKVKKTKSKFNNHHSGDEKNGNNCCGSKRKTYKPCQCKCQSCSIVPHCGGCGGRFCGRIYGCSGSGGGTCCFPRNTKRRSGIECCGGGGKGCGGCC